MTNSTLPEDIERARESAGKAAVDFIKDGMLVGLGTGSTAAYFIKHLIERCHAGLKIKAVATSQKSMHQALKGGIPFLDVNTVTSIDITVDGADEIDSSKRMIKGGGGALLREKIIAKMSKEMIVIVDENKCVNQLGQSSLPIEIIPFGFLSTINQLEKIGYHGSLRTTESDAIFLTDNGNYILDLYFPLGIKKPEEDERKIRAITGVVETGFFFHLASHVIVGYRDGHVEIRS